MLKRFVLSIVIFAALMVVATSVLRPWYDRWGATQAELSMSLPGDELVPHAAHQATMGITVRATPEEIWPWLVQMGAGRAGLYSYSWFDRTLGCQMRNTGRIVPELQNPQVGDLVRMCAGEFGPPPFTVAAIQPGQAFIYGSRDEADTAWESTTQFVLVPQSAGSTRLLMRSRSSALTAFDAVLGPGYFIMLRRQMQGIQQRAEGTLPAEWVVEAEIFLWLLAFIGFLIAGGLLVFRPLRSAAVDAGRAGRTAAVFTGIAALATLFLAFAQPPLWVDVLVVAGIYGGRVLPRKSYA